MYGTKIALLITRVEARRLVADFYNQGMTIKEIAAQVPVSLATVYRWINLPNHKSIKQKSEPKTEDLATGGDSTKSVSSGNSNCETALSNDKFKYLINELTP